MSRPLRLFLPFAVGAVSACGFAPLDLWPLTVLGIALLAALVERAPSWRAAAATGWLFGTGQFVVGLAWIATAFTFQAAMPAFTGWIAVVLLSMFLGVYPGLAAGVARGFPGRPLARLLVFAAAWMTTEWLRGHLLSGFAWNPLGAAWLDAGGVAQGAAWVGALGLSGLMVLAGGAVAITLARGWLAAATAFGAVCGVAALTAFAVPAASPALGPIVHLVQPNLGQDIKYDDPAGHVEKYLALTRAALGPRPLPEGAIVIWSESSVEDLVEEDPAARARLAAVLGPHDLLLFGGVALNRDAEGRPTSATNSLYVLDAEARLRGRYDKAHLVPLGEYLPLRPLVSRFGLARLVPGDIDFLAGPGPRTLALPGFPDAGIQICYEVIFPAEVVDEARRPAWLVNISNDAWFGAWGPPQHLAQARLRAIEEGLPIARVTPTGISAMIDAHGRIVAAIGPRRAASVTLRLPAPRSPTPFARFAHWTSFALGLGLVLVAAAFAFRRI